MPFTRTVTDVQDDLSFITYLFSERNFQSPWANQDVSVIVFADHSLPGFSVQNHGGSVGSGIPVELLFWGDWWNSSEGIARRDLYITRVQAVLASNYFSELAQYGIAKPHWRGAKVVTDPEPLSAFHNDDDQQSVPDLIDALIDDDVFPDPDDEKIAFVVFMAKGFTQTTGANGAHMNDYNYTFPWDKDWFWVAWVRYFGDPTGKDQNPEDAIRTFTHELVEMLSDPEVDAWYTNNPQTGEIGDAGATPKGGAKQAAWVNGAHVQAYWSNQHGATVIPIDRDYRARILGTIRLDHREVVNGTFSPDPEDTKLCDLLPQCCLEKRDYKFTIVKRDEVVRLSVETQRYRQTQVAWFVEGNAVMADVVLSLNVIAGIFVGHEAKFVSKSVLVQCKLSNNQLTLRTVGTEANFDINVTCTVSEMAIAGNVKTNVLCKPSLTIGFVGAELTVDPEYLQQRAACEKAARDLFKKAGLGKSQKAKIGDPVEFGPALLQDVPAYARVHQYVQARRVIDLARMAHAFLPQETAKALTASLVSDVPALQGALAIRAATNSCQDETQNPS
jgi:hypothetical protein